MKSLVSGFIIGLFMCSCSSTPKSPDGENMPAWVHNSTRTVDGGYIVYVGSGEDRSPDKARFKAEAMALQDLSNECSFAPKGTRVEDRFDQMEGVLHHTFAKVAVEFQDCEAAKKAVSPDQIRTLANAQMTDQIKRYQDLVDEPEPEETAPLALASNDTTSPQGSHGPASGPVVGGSGYFGGPASFIIVRQQVAYVKQDVILAPPAQYPPASPQTTQPIPPVLIASNSLSQYETAHPEIRTSPQAFSTLRPNAINHQSDALRETRDERARMRQAYPGAGPGRNGKRRGQPAQSGKGHKKRGWRPSRNQEG